MQKKNHPRSNHLGEINQKPKKEIFTLSHPCVAVLLDAQWEPWKYQYSKFGGLNIV